MAGRDRRAAHLLGGDGLQRRLPVLRQGEAGGGDGGHGQQGGRGAALQVGGVGAGAGVVAGAGAPAAGD